MNQRLDDDWLQFVNLPRRPEFEDVVRVVMIIGALLVAAFTLAMAIGIMCMLVTR